MNYSSREKENFHNRHRRKIDEDKNLSNAQTFRFSVSDKEHLAK